MSKLWRRFRDRYQVRQERSERSSVTFSQDRLRSRKVSSVDAVWITAVYTKLCFDLQKILEESYAERFRPNTFDISKELSGRKGDTDSYNRHCLCWKLLKNNSLRTRKNRALATRTRAAQDLVLPLN